MPPRPDSIVSPLSIAAYVTWAAVSYAVWQESGTWAAFGGIPARGIATVSLLIFLAATVLLSLPSRTTTVRPGFMSAVLAVQILATFCVLGLGPQSTSPVLLIVVAAEVVLRTGPRVGWIVLLLVNGAFYGVLVDLWHADNPVFAACLYGGFQLFAALTVDSMKRAQIAAAELRLSNAELLATRSLLAESARDGERLRVSRELHDVVGHKLSALSLNLEMLHVDSSTPARRELRLARELSQEILSDIRGVVSSLRDHDGIDLQEALTRLTSMFPAPAISLHLQPGLRVAGTQRAEALLRCAQEALANVARHARAAHAEVSLSEDPTHVSLTVEDDGSFAGELNPGNGLTGLKERIESLRGTVTIDRGARGGCRVVARLPRLD